MILEYIQKINNYNIADSMTMDVLIIVLKIFLIT